jgi:hypothetical protein
MHNVWHTCGNKAENIITLFINHQMALAITFYRKFMVERLKGMENVKFVDKIGQ